MKLRYVALFLIAVSMGCSSGGSDSSDRLGNQIDAVGRAAINTALNMTFAPDAMRNEALDLYNATANSDRARFIGTFAGQLAVYDSLVGECGDNPLTNRASADPADGLATGPGRYNFLATVLADDQLYVNAASGGAAAGQCNQYLAVELGVIGVEGLTADCGGRTPTQDTIEVTYSAVAIGGVAGVNDGLTGDPLGTPSLTEFPFLAPPLS